MVGITCFIGGLICGVVLLYVILFVLHRLKNKKNAQVPNSVSTSPVYENAGAVNVSAYEELDLNRMGVEDSYQSLEMNTTSGEEEPKQNEAGYTELYKTRENKDENYQSLNRV